MDTNETNEQTKKGGNNVIVLSVAVVALFVMIVLGALLVHSKGSTNGLGTTSGKSSSQGAVESAKTTSPSSSDVTFKDGTYTATGNYESPEGSESIDVTITLSSNTITNVSITNHGIDHDSVRYQGMFKEGVASVVVGKKINGLSLSRVSGSSLTPIGFNNALQKIEAQARS